MVTSKLGIWGSTPIAILQDHAVTPNALKVYIALSSFQGQNNFAFPSVEAIAERAGIKRDAVASATACLCEAGWLQKRRHGLGKPNTYSVLLKSEEIEPESGTNPTLESGFNPTSGKRIDSDTKTPYQNNNIKHHLKTTAQADSDCTSLAPLAPSKDDTLKCLKDSIRQSFLAVQPFGNYPRENAQVKRLADTVLRFFPDDPLTSARAMLESYYRLTKGRDKFWSSQPFTPSALVSLWDRVWTERTKTSGSADVSWLER